MATSILSLREVGYAYPKGGFRLAGISFSLAEGEKLAIQGPSGAGKSTLLGLIGLLGDGPHEGTYLLFGRDVASLNERERARIRNEDLAFVFQDLNLIPQLTLLENVRFTLEI